MKSYQRCFGALLNSKRFKLKDFFRFSLYQALLFSFSVCLCGSFCPLVFASNHSSRESYLFKTKGAMREAAREREAIPRTGRVDVMMMTRTDRVDVINNERQRSCSGARSNPAHRPTEDDIEALREREAIPRGDSHSDDRRWKNDDDAHRPSRCYQ